MKQAVRWLVVLVALAGTARCAVAGEGADSQYYSIFLQGKRVGYMFQQRKLTGGQVHTRHEMAVTLRRGPAAVTVRETTTSVETLAGEPVRFSSRQDLGGSVKWVTGTVDPNGTVHAETVTAEGKARKTFPWPEGALLAEGVRIAQRAHGLEPGTRYELLEFLPSMLQDATQTNEVGPVRKVDVMGTAERLHEVTTTTKINGISQSGTFYVTDDYGVRRLEVPMMGMTLVMVASSKARAMLPAESMDVLMSTSVQSPRRLDNIDEIKRIVYELSPIDGQPLEVPDTGSQAANVADDRTIVKVRPDGVDHAAGRAPAGPTEADLAPSEYINSDDAKVRELMRRVVSEGDSPPVKALAIRSFVYRHIRNKNLDLGWASAARVARDPQGDCSEHAVLAAAMCRAADIPARVVVGVVYATGPNGKEAFWPHAWFTFWDGRRWVDLDATRREDFGAGHIALATGNGSPVDLMSLAETLGRFRITRMAVER